MQTCRPCRDREIGMLEYRNIALHPRMYVALYRDSDFLSAETRLYRWHSLRLRLIPLATVRWERVDVVCGGVVVLHEELLAGLHSNYVPMILASLLFNDCGFLWWIEVSITQPVPGELVRCQRFNAMSHCPHRSKTTVRQPQVQRQSCDKEFTFA